MCTRRPDATPPPDSVNDPLCGCRTRNRASERDPGTGADLVHAQAHAQGRAGDLCGVRSKPLLNSHDGSCVEPGGTALGARPAIPASRPADSPLGPGSLPGIARAPSGSSPWYCCDVVCARCARIFAMTSGSSMLAMMASLPPQRAALDINAKDPLAPSMHPRPDAPASPPRAALPQSARLRPSPAAGRRTPKAGYCCSPSSRGKGA
jgi:hypothetical protein